MKRRTHILLLTMCIVTFVGWRNVRTEEPSRAQIQNVRAFAKVYGYVRYFHPSDEAAAIDWERFVVNGVRQVRDAEGMEELQTALQVLFNPIAPTVRIFSTSDGPPVPPPELTPNDTAGLKIVAWQHEGVDLDSPYPGYQSRRLNRPSAVQARGAPSR